MFVKDLKEVGFTLNPYDLCVANKTINGHQQTLCWHVDDVKSSHVNKKVQDAFENWLIDKYDWDQNGKIVGKIKKCEGKRLDYMGWCWTIQCQVKLPLT